MFLLAKELSNLMFVPHMFLLCFTGKYIQTLIIWTLEREILPSIQDDHFKRLEILSAQDSPHIYGVLAL